MAARFDDGYLVVSDAMVEEVLGLQELLEGQDPLPQPVDASFTTAVLGGGVAKKKGASGNNSAIQRRYREKKKEHVKELERKNEMLEARIKELEAQNEALRSTQASEAATLPACSPMHSEPSDSPEASADDNEKRLALDQAFTSEVGRMKELLDHNAGEVEIAKQLEAVSSVCRNLARSFPETATMARLPNFEATEQHGVFEEETWRGVVKTANFDEATVDALLAWRRGYLEELSELFNDREEALAALHGNRHRSLSELVSGNGRALAAVEQLKESLREQQRITMRYVSTFFGKALGGPRRAGQVIAAAFPNHVDPLALTNFLHRERLRLRG